MTDANIVQLADRVLNRLSRAQRARIATYRVQLTAEFPFPAAGEQAAYLADLGISHVYASPFFRARPGSNHGYDVCSHSEFNPELGGAEAFQQYMRALHDHHLGQILDLVPNHMAASTENPWWNDVLENGPVSPYAAFFDIDWQPIKDELTNKILLPQLGAPYGEVLENGELKLEAQDGSFFLRYYETCLPIGPKTILPVLLYRSEDLALELGADSEAFIEYQSILTALEHLPPQTATNPRDVAERHREKEVIKRRLRDLQAKSPAVKVFIEKNLNELNGQVGQPASFDRLDAILSAQAYRLCYWRSASDEINYRRFFDVNDLAAICMEEPDVFRQTHGLVGQLLANHDLEGLRIDHIDGLFAPEAYLWRLQWLYLTEMAHQELLACLEEHVREPDGEWATHTGPAVLQELCHRLELKHPDPQDLKALFGNPTQTTIPKLDDSTEVNRTVTAKLPLYVVVEKILGPDEPLPASWPVNGTSGYDFLNSLNGLMIHPEGYRDLQRLFAKLTGDRRTFSEVAETSKSLVMRVSMASELQMLAHRLNRISEQHRRSRDLTLNSLRFALREILVCFPVYRTYPGPQGISDRDRRVVNRAVDQACRRNPAIDPAVFEFIRGVLLLQHPPGLSEGEIQEREFFTGRFQQVTSPVMAKGVEDTSFYVHLPLATANEVGSHPPHAPLTIDEFHRENLTRSHRNREALLCTSTHDTKRSEDVRARINVLSEIPDLWRQRVKRWFRLNARHRQMLEDGPVPSPTDEYLLYQILVGTWPLESLEGNLPDDYLPRLQAYLEKASREAKQRTSWIRSNPDYDQGLKTFVQNLLDPQQSTRFLDDIRLFLQGITDAGLLNAATQVALKLLSPGVPDLYQGQELWDFSLVDPDNRRPVDYLLRRNLLTDVREKLHTEPDQFVKELGHHPRDARLKMLVTSQLLKVRRLAADLLLTGKYTPLFATGDAAEHVLAFEWHQKAARPGVGPGRMLVVVARWWLALHREVLGEASFQGLPDAKIWGETQLHLPAQFTGLLWDVWTGKELTVAGETIPVAPLLSDLPVAVYLDQPME